MSDDHTEAAAQHVDDLYARSAHHFQDPPKTLGETLKHLGPGLILVGSIVGSGELIMTTKLGAEAGFIFLWFVILSCLIKVVVQTELVRHTISSGETILQVMNDLPGPAWQRPRWFTLEWLASVLLISLAAVTVYITAGNQDRQRGTAGAAILGTALALMTLSAWLINRWKASVPQESPTRAPRLNWFIYMFLICQMGMFINGGAILGGSGQTLQLAFPVLGDHGAQFWAVIVGVVVAALLVGGKYIFLERISVGLVAGFTLTTAICTIILQWTDYAISMDDLKSGLAFAMPTPLHEGVLITALAVYAATGIGHWEMLSYTYWCIEKGYARNTGANVPGDEWAIRARGWVRVMYIDALLTMVVYTLSTICFYLLGAAILYGGEPVAGIQTLSVLRNVYTESLSGAMGDYAATLFIVGAFFVLFSTSLSGAASGSRILADALAVLGFIDRGDYTARLRFVRIAIVMGLTINAYAYYLFEDPTLMLMITSMISVFIYPSLGLGALYLRYRGVDQRILPGGGITALLWVCGLTLGVLSPAIALVSLAIKQKWITL